MTLAGKPIKRPLLVDEIATRLRSDILNGHLQPGQRIPVASIARDLGVSHIPVREAIRRLEAESLVGTIPHQWPVVAGVRLEELHEIYTLRRLIEGDLARRAVGCYTDADITQIQGAAQRLWAADPKDPDGDFWTAHRAFHWAVLRPAMDSWSERILGLLWQSAERYHRLFTLVFGSLTEAHAEHRALTEAAAAKDQQALVRVLVSHLHRTEQTVTTGYLEATARQDGLG
ncbi:MAG: GntR family transcriptional regulator [Egibacteraceae bacterium]